MNLFRAQPVDVCRIKECAELCCAEHGEGRMGGQLNWGHYRDVLTNLVMSNHGAMWLYEDGGKIVAGLCGAIHTDPLTGLPRATRVFVYALPEYRGRPCMLGLMLRFEVWAREQGCTTITQSLLDTMPEATKRVYEKMGYAEQETIYLKRL